MVRSELRHAFHVGQEGEFVHLDAYRRPVERIDGKIIRLMDGENALYALVETPRGVRPARLA